MESGVKGSIMEGIVADLVRLRDEGQLDAAELETRLEPEDLELFDQKVQAALWYPLPCFTRMTELLLASEGGGDVTYLERRGRAAADRLRQAGTYPQLSADPEIWGDRLGNIVISIGPAMIQGTQWSFELTRDGDEASGFVVDVELPPDFNPVLRHSLAGFIAATSEALQDLPLVVRSELRDGGVRFIAERGPDS
ncbi:MAG: hypothetical protein CL910_08090 [Deltaproteobacteria bacterium]|nr:hypothetical protein [Deltaproteobacteria bacterium]